MMRPQSRVHLLLPASALQSRALSAWNTTLPVECNSLIRDYWLETVDSTPPPHASIPAHLLVPWLAGFQCMYMAAAAAAATHLKWVGCQEHPQLLRGFQPALPLLPFLRPSGGNPLIRNNCFGQWLAKRQLPSFSNLCVSGSPTGAISPAQQNRKTEMCQVLRKSKPLHLHVALLPWWKKGRKKKRAAQRNKMTFVWVQPRVCLCSSQEEKKQKGLLGLREPEHL